MLYSVRTAAQPAKAKTSWSSAIYQQFGHQPVLWQIRRRGSKLKLPGLPCDSQLCDFVFAYGTLEQKLQQPPSTRRLHTLFSSINREAVHPGVTLRPVSDLESWEFSGTSGPTTRWPWASRGAPPQPTSMGAWTRSWRGTSRSPGVAAAYMTEAALLEATRKFEACIY